MKDLYRDETNQDCYSDNSNGSYSDEYVRWLEKSCEEKNRRVSKLEKGLQWLVNLKTKKDLDGKDEIYLREQPKAWENAKQLLNL